MNRWLTYVRERFPLHTYIVLVAGISLSGMFLHGGPFRLVAFIISFIGLLLFFGLLRLMNEVKDFDKDRIAHPERPLPRALIKKDEALYIINLVQPMLVAYGMLVWVILDEIAALAYISIVFYVWMMYQDFFIKKWIKRHPLIKGIFQQLVVFPVAFFAIAVRNPGNVLSPDSWSFAGMLLGAFFCYEICRRLDPHTHPILATYVQFYGFRRTFEIAAIALAVSAMGASALNLAPLLAPCELLVLGSLALLFFQPAWFLIPEVAASISLILHVWAVVLFYYFK